MLNTKRFWAGLVFVLLITGATVAQNRQDPRATVQSFFALLKSGQYAALYEFLPAQLQQQTTREQLAQSLKQLDSTLAIERMEIGRIQQRNDVAVVDTTIYGRLKRPMKINGQEVKEGRAITQQILLRENGQWKVSSADSRARAFFLKRNPDFAKQFKLTRPNFEFQQDGQWRPIGGR